MQAPGLLPAAEGEFLNRSWVQAGQCGRCRADLGQAGKVCMHCRLDELLMAWELRLFSLQAHAVNKRGLVTAEDALRQAWLQLTFATSEAVLVKLHLQISLGLL